MKAVVILLVIFPELHKSDNLFCAVFSNQIECRSGGVGTCLWQMLGFNKIKRKKMAISDQKCLLKNN